MQRIPALRVIYFRSTKTRNFQLCCQFLKKVEVTDWWSFDPVVILPKSMDCFCTNGILVKKSLFFRTGEKRKNFNQYQNEHSCLWKWMSDMVTRLKWSLWNHVYDVKQTSRKKPQFQKIRKLQNLFHFNESGISCIESLVFSNLDASPKCCKRMEQSWLLAYEFMGRWTWQILQ